MLLSSDEAVEVARKHRLGLPDAQALTRLCDTVEEADKLAEQFAGHPPEDAEKAATRKLTRDLFQRAKDV